MDWRIDGWTGGRFDGFTSLRIYGFVNVRIYWLTDWTSWRLTDYRIYVFTDWRVVRMCSHMSIRSPATPLSIIVVLHHLHLLLILLLLDILDIRSILHTVHVPHVPYSLHMFEMMCTCVAHWKHSSQPTHALHHCHPFSVSSCVHSSRPLHSSNSPHNFKRSLHLWLFFTCCTCSACLPLCPCLTSLIFFRFLTLSRCCFSSHGDFGCPKCRVQPSKVAENLT